MLEERHKTTTGQVKDLFYGLYGKTAVPIDAEVQKKTLKDYARGENPFCGFSHQKKFSFTKGFSHAC
ncbi:MAG: hypothetical protein WCF40_11085 [Desulfobacterales bacterium]